MGKYISKNRYRIDTQLRIHTEAAGITLRDLAKTLKIPKSTLNNYYVGICSAGIETITSIAAALSMTTEQFLGFRPEPATALKRDRYSETISEPVNNPCGMKRVLEIIGPGYETSSEYGFTAKDRNYPIRDGAGRWIQ